MFICMSKSRIPLNITTIGDENVGKTCLCKTYINNLYEEEFIPTFLHCFDIKLTVDNKKYSLSLMDTGCGEEYDHLRAIYYPTTSCFLLCYSVYSRYSFEAIEHRWLPEICKYTKDTPVVLVGTRLDLRTANPEDCVTTAEGLLLKDKINAYSFVECSAKEGINLENVFVEAVRAAKSKLKEKKGNKIKKCLHL